MSLDLNGSLIFVKVAELGSFIAAARALRMPTSTVSRKVQALESRLGVQLLQRTTRSLDLTEAGSVYHARCRRIARDLEEAESAVGQLQLGPRGHLRFATPYDVGITWIAPLLGEFHARHPEIQVEMVLGNEPRDIIDEGFDVALRIGPLPDSGLVARRLAVFRTQVYASHGYLARHGEPMHPGELRHHRALGLRTQGRDHDFCWPLGEGGALADYPIEPVLVSNDFGALKGALLGDKGLMLACDVTIKSYAERDQVQHVLPGWTGPDLAFSAVFPRGQAQSPKVRAFVDFLVERLSFDADYMRQRCPDGQPPERCERRLAAVA